jgi:hypothetical protein
MLNKTSDGHKWTRAKYDDPFKYNFQPHFNYQLALDFVRSIKSQIPTMRKSSWNFGESIAGSLRTRLEICRSRECSYSASPVHKRRRKMRYNNWECFKSLQLRKLQWCHTPSKWSKKSQNKGWDYFGAPFCMETRWWYKTRIRLLSILMALCIPVKWAATAQMTTMSTNLTIWAPRYLILSDTSTDINMTWKWVMWKIFQHIKEYNQYSATITSNWRRIVNYIFQKTM